LHISEHSLKSNALVLILCMTQYFNHLISADAKYGLGTIGLSDHFS